MSDGTKAALAAIAALMDAHGLTAADVAEQLASDGAVVAHRTVADHLKGLRASLGEGTGRGYNTHFNRFEHGIVRLCDGTCRTCSAWEDRQAACSCTCSTCERSALEWSPAADRPMRNGEFSRSELEPFAVLAQRLARRKALLDNRHRAQRGLEPKPDHGQGGREMAVSALRCLFERAIDDELIDRNPAEKLDKGTRGEPRRRALKEPELVELLDVIVSGGDDPELDLLITWAELELGSRRGGVLALTVGGLSRHRQTARLFEKGSREREQPMSLDLLEELLAHAARRGGPRCEPGKPDFDPAASALYFKDSTPEHPHPLTSRRFDTLHVRLQKALPWANEMGYSGHAMRHTLGTAVERLFGAKVAEAVLGHGPKKPTDIYTQARLEDRAKAISAITGKPHPLAGDSA